MNFTTFHNIVRISQHVHEFSQHLLESGMPGLFKTSGHSQNKSVITSKEFSENLKSENQDIQLFRCNTQCWDKPHSYMYLIHFGELNIYSRIILNYGRAAAKFLKISFKNNDFQWKIQHLSAENSKIFAPAALDQIYL